MLLGLLLAIPVLLAFLSWFYLFRNDIPIPVNVPGGRFLLGHVHLLANIKPWEFEQFYLNLQNPKYGPITHLKFFYESHLCLNTVRTAECLLKSPYNINKSVMYDPLEVLMKDSVILLNDEKWQARRKMLTPSFHFTIIEAFEKSIVKYAMILVDVLSKDPHYPLLEALKQVTMATIMESSFGTEFNDHLDQFKLIGDSLELAERYVLLRTTSIFANKKWDWFYYKFTERGQETRKAINTLNSIMSDLIEDRKRELQLGETKLYKGRRSFLDLLVKEQADNGNLTDEQIIGECNTIVLAGHETSAASMGFTIYYLCKHPELQQKVYDEIMTELDGKDFAELNIAELKYLAMFIKESMRLQPAIGFIGRQLTNAQNIGGVVLPAGTDINIAIKWIHRDPEVWESSEKFDPERFSAENCRNRNPYAFVPFSAGPRGCLGQRIALTQMKIMIAALVYHFKMTTKQELGKDIFRQGLLVMVPGPDFAVDFQPRFFKE